MPKIPRRSEVRKAIASLTREVRLAVKDVNQHAGRLLGRGDYVGAQALIDVAKSISQFGEEVKSLKSRWNEACGAARVAGGKNADQTPLWEFYRPILRALVAVGGEAKRTEIEAELEGKIENTLKEGDFVKNARGIPRWKRMIGRARKQMVAEGFVADRSGTKWEITRKGEQAAKSGVKGK